ncbi:hypothetical protein PNOK_0627200 [Pyrrhoderma noxium]|uniref:Uncharacterized protein n=1 Tax=Pyrrhoderma noxium TaxID=2282107 RepID=A0A286UDW1_9AGAM|nr:hypothetical protein PNOK_0627200 [Pyrrhoderma noxium]
MGNGASLLTQRTQNVSTCASNRKMHLLMTNIHKRPRTDAQQEMCLKHGWDANRRVRASPLSHSRHHLDSTVFRKSHHVK